MTTDTPTMAQLVTQFNLLVAEATSSGLTKFKPVNSKFKTIADGQRRIEVIQSAIRARAASERAVANEAEPVTTIEAPAPATEENNVAKKRKSRTAAVRQRAPKQSLANGTSIKAKTQTWNEEAKEARKEYGLSQFRHHTSDFGSHEAADKQLKRLRAAIAAAQRG